MLDQPKQTNNLDIGADLFFHLSHQSLLSRFSEFRSATWKSPEVIALSLV